MILSAVSYSQTPITNINFQDAINTCLDTNPRDGLCSTSEFGKMPDWDVSNVIDMSMAPDSIRFQYIIPEIAVPNPQNLAECHNLYIDENVC